MKEFLGTFVICFVLSVVALVLFSGLLANNIWFYIAAFSLLLAAMITILIKLDSRIDELEMTVKQLQNEKEQPSDS